MAESKKGKNWFFYIYKISEAETLPDIPFSYTVAGDRHNKPDRLNSFWLQGFAIDANRHIYFYEGEGNRQGRSAQAYVTVLDLKGGIVEGRTKVKAIMNARELDDAGIINNSGNLEPEGMTVKGNSVYLGFLSHKVGNNNNDKRASIFRYDSQPKHKSN